jgi:hypothetical protein
MKTIFYTLIASVYSLMISAAAYADGKGFEHHQNFGLRDIIVTLGILTLISILLTFLMGYFMPKNRKLLFVWHKRAAIAALILAFSHGVMVFIFQ